MPTDAHLLQEAKKTVVALGRMFAPFCEVVLHDYRNPKHTIVAIENPLSGRKVGDSVTEIGIARIQDASFPDVVQNYKNILPDGRVMKSTSIGIRNAKGKYIGSICLNMDVTLFSNVNALLQQFTSTEEHGLPVQEHLRSMSVDELETQIQTLAAKAGKTPRTLEAHERQQIVGALHRQGWLRLQRAVPIAASLLGVTRATVYNDCHHAQQHASKRTIR